MHFLRNKNPLTEKIYGNPRKSRINVSLTCQQNGHAYTYIDLVAIKLDRAMGEITHEDIKWTFVIGVMSNFVSIKYTTTLASFFISHRPKSVQLTTNTNRKSITRLMEGCIKNNIFNSESLMPFLVYFSSEKKKVDKLIKEHFNSKMRPPLI